MANIQQTSHDLGAAEMPIMNEKSAYENVEHYATTEEMQRAISAGAEPVMRSKVDDLKVWQAIKQYKLVTCLAMAAAFSASLDGYRRFLHDQSSLL